MKFTPLIALIAGASVLTACVTPQGDPDRTRTGLLTGAIAGGLLGAATGSGNRTPEVLIGAGLGAMAGGMIGQHMDRQAEELRQSLGSQVNVQYDGGNEIVLTMPQDILFATDSTTLRSDLRADLQTIAGSLQRYPDSSIIVTGHTDSTGSAEYNQRLSEGRADAVATVLIQSGVPSRRVVARGAGESRPVASNDSAVGRSQNRRVEITIRSNG
jgi:outer membrane protein OmpA-like peptidoglycan-associated protein